MTQFERNAAETAVALGVSMETAIAMEIAFLQTMTKLAVDNNIGDADVHAKNREMLDAAAAKIR